MNAHQAWLALLALGIGPAVAAGADSSLELEAVLEPQMVAVGQPVQLTLRVIGQGLSGLELQPAFALDNLVLTAGPAESRQVRIRNLSVTRIHSLTWQLSPQAPGPAAVRDIRVTVNDRSMRLPDQAIEVVDEPVSAPPPQGGARQAPAHPIDELMQLLPRSLRREDPRSILRAEITPASAWEGQQVLYSLHLYTQARFRSSSWRHLPGFQSFWARSVPLPDPRPSEIVDLDGERYTHAILLQWALFPLAAGSHEIGPAELELLADMPGEGVLGSLRSVPRPMRLRSRPVTVEVRELPPPPGGFAGAVGRYSLRAALEPEQIPVGDAATLTVELSGRGNLQGASDPELEPPEGVKLHPAASRGEESFDGTTVRGDRTWTFPLVGSRPGRFSLAPPPFVYFDPWTGEYATAAVAPLVLSVEPAAAAPQATAQPLDARQGAADGREWTARWRWLVAAAAVLAALALLGTWLWRQRTAADAEFAAALVNASHAGSPRHAAARLEAAWRELLTRRHGVPAATPVDHWSERLAAAGMPAPLTASLDALLADLRYLRQAPELASTDSLHAELMERSRRLASRLTRRAH